ncbi:hypothetical protein JWG42_06090 [Desulfoprunum benzoelyticum]|uniref:Uncharacterized protein n=1 Tax=Desulfoprunum benzoelyticum TaxID=1506996 RepID=A0A840UN20_9BACT|nr:hypothetical protein [Desulfoprunum benzoelyticum]MBB5347025.1 hypothetical protein [Desulfoprunum benzoelyticum]MBM9529719.1 hypothetical protein [Desulfoprunum benzoelyticum]
MEFAKKLMKQGMPELIHAIEKGANPAEASARLNMSNSSGCKDNLRIEQPAVSRVIFFFDLSSVSLKE